MPSYTPNHEYTTWALGETDWQHNDDMQSLDGDVEIRDIDANKSNYTAKQDALFLATDTGRRYVGDGSTWTELSYPVAGDGSLTTPDSVINVPSDEPTVDAALSRIDDEYYPAGHSVTITIESGHDMQEPVSKARRDYRHVTITAENNEVVNLADGFPTGSYPFRFSKACHTPHFDIMLDGQHDGAKHPLRAFQIWGGSIVSFTPLNERKTNDTINYHVGAMNCEMGLSVMMGSKAVAFGAKFSDNIRRGASISNGSWAYLQEAILTNNDNHSSGDDGFGLRCGESVVQVHFADVRNNKHGVHANQSSSVGANGLVAHNCNNALYVAYAVRINARNLAADNCSGNVVQSYGSMVNLNGATSDSGPRFIRAVEGSLISAHDITISNTTQDSISIIDGSQGTVVGDITNSGGSGVSIDNGSQVFVDGSVTGSSNNDIVIDEGSIVSLGSGMLTTNSSSGPHTSDMSHAPNQVHGAGIIFAMNPE